MDLFEAIQKRHTTNGAFADRPIDPEHKRTIPELAARAPSHFNSQPWRFVVVEDAERRRALGRIAGESMRDLMADGRFWQQYRRYFRLTPEEVAASKDGIHIDNIPSVLMPFAKYIFTERGAAMMNTFRVPGVLTGLYTLISLGAVIQTIWLSATSLGMGFQFVSTPQEIPEKWALISALLGVPEGFELMVLCRLVYEDPAIKRRTIDWAS